MLNLTPGAFRKASSVLISSSTAAFFDEADRVRINLRLLGKGTNSPTHKHTSGPELWPCHLTDTSQPGLLVWPVSANKFLAHSSKFRGRDCL